MASCSMAAARNVSAAASMTLWRLRLEIMRQLGRGGRLAGAVDADDEDRLGLVGQRADRRRWRAGSSAHDRRAGDLHHVLGRRRSRRAPGASSRISWVSGTPRSARMSVSSSSSQSTGRPVNFWTRDLKKPMATVGELGLNPKPRANLKRENELRRSGRCRRCSRRPRAVAVARRRCAAGASGRASRGRGCR